MKSVTLSALGVVLTYLILISFGWIGLLVSLPFFFFGTLPHSLGEGKVAA